MRTRDNKAFATPCPEKEVTLLGSEQKGGQLQILKAEEFPAQVLDPAPMCEQELREKWWLAKAGLLEDLQTA